MLDHLREGVLAFDRNGRIIAFNSGTARFSRRDLTRAALMQWVEHIAFFLPDMETPCPPDQLPAARAMRGEAVREMILFVRHPALPGGLWVSVDAQPLGRPKGTRSGAIAVFRQVNGTERADLAVKRSEETFRSLIENVQDVVSVLDAAGRIRFVSPAIENTLGYRPEELLGRATSNLIHPEDLPRFLETLTTLTQKPDGLVADEFRCRHKDGSWRHLAGKAKNLLGSPTVRGIVVTVRDMTERVRAEQEALFHASLLEHLRTAVIALDAEGRIIYWNNFAWKLYHWTTKEVLGKQIAEVVVPPSGAGRYEELLQDVRKAGYCESEFRMQRADGSTFPVLLTIAAVRCRRGKLIGHVNVAIDISERKDAEKRLKASRAQLRELAARNRSALEAERARIAGDIHDELGQQLTVLKMELFQIAKALGGRAASRELTWNVRSAVGVVDSTLESVRRIAAQLRPSALDDLGLAAAIEWQCQEFHVRTQIPCTLERADEDLPLEPERATEVFRIFQEILTNVARHANASAVKAALRREHDDLVLDVRDNGKGIMQREVKALGSLGILGMRERALRLGGELLVQGVRGKGTRVSLRAPIRGPKEDHIEDIDS